MGTSSKRTREPQWDGQEDRGMLPSSPLQEGLAARRIEALPGSPLMEGRRQPFRARSSPVCLPKDSFRTLNKKCFKYTKHLPKEQPECVALGQSAYLHVQGSVLSHSVPGKYKLKNKKKTSHLCLLSNPSDTLESQGERRKAGMGVPVRSSHE